VDSKRRCGTCDLCCRLLGVEEIQKPAFQKCPRIAKPRGAAGACSIYESRPAACAGFRCGWLAGFGRDDQRPDRVGFVMIAPSMKPPIAQVRCWAIDGDALAAARDIAQKTGLAVAVVPRTGDRQIIAMPGSEGEKMIKGAVEQAKSLGIRVTASAVTYEPDDD
jgi:hypothetical protein